MEYIVDEVRKALEELAAETNSGKMTIGYDCQNGGYFEMIYYVKKPKNK